MDAIVLSGVSGLVAGSFITAFILTQNRALKSQSYKPAKANWDADVDPWLENKPN